MPFQVSYLVEHKIILAKLEGEMTIADFADIDAQAIALLRIAQDPHQLIHFIIDARDIGKMPTNLAEINAISHIRSEAQLGWMIIINANKIIRFLGNLITQITKTRYRNFETLDEAIAFLKTQDSTIDWSAMTIIEE